MSMLKITGGNSLCGSVRIGGAKNSVLPILASTILIQGEILLHNCPTLSDVDAALEILNHLGCRTIRSDDTIYVDSRLADRCDIPDDLMREMRSSVIFLGAVLARNGSASLSMPGGCELGPRPIDMHLAALKEMGAYVSDVGGSIHCRLDPFEDAVIDLPFPSVGATENSMLAAAKATGKVVINNAAREPEISDLQSFMRKLGVNVSGAGSSTIYINGFKPKSFAEHCVIPDRIVASTIMSAAAIAGGDVTLSGVIQEHVVTATDVLSEMGCDISFSNRKIRIISDGILKSPKPIITRPYPGFPTDAQPPLMAACLKCEGTAVFIENIFANRYRHAAELIRMGADIKTEGRVAAVCGVKALHGAKVSATDLRGGAALVVAALAAEGATYISEIHHIQRGYERIEELFSKLGAEIEIV